MTDNLRTENYPREAYLSHPNRDPSHIYGGAKRYVDTPIGRRYFLPRNPGRYLGHEGGASAERLTFPTFEIKPTRQLKRRRILLARKRAGSRPTRPAKGAK